MKLIIIPKFWSPTQCNNIINTYDDQTLIIDDPDYSIYHRADFIDRNLQQSLIQDLNQENVDCAISNRFFYTKYLPGGFIDLHTDGHVNIGEIQSTYTGLIYLTPTSLYTGGQLVIHSGDKMKILPSQGTLVLMDQDLLHNVDEISSGHRELLRFDAFRR